MIDMSKLKQIAESTGFSEDKYELFWDEDANSEGVDLLKYGDAIVKSIVNMLMVQHEAAAGRHNYWQVAANLIEAEYGTGSGN